MIRAEDILLVELSTEEKELLTQILNDKFSVGAFTGMIFNSYIKVPNHTIPELIKQALMVRLVARRMIK